MRIGNITCTIVFLMIAFGGTGVSWGWITDSVTTPILEPYEANGFRTQTIHSNIGTSFGSSCFDPTNKRLYYTGMQGETFLLLQYDLPDDRLSIRARSSSYLKDPANPVDRGVFFLTEDDPPWNLQVVESLPPHGKKFEWHTEWASYIWDYCVNSKGLAAVIAAAGPVEQTLWVRDKKGEWHMLDTDCDDYKITHFNSRCAADDSVIYWTTTWGYNPTISANRLSLDTLTTRTLKSFPWTGRDIYEPELTPTGELWGITDQGVIRIDPSGKESVVYPGKRWKGLLEVNSHYVTFFESDKDHYGDGHGHVVILDKTTNAVIKRLPTKLEEGISPDKALK